MKPIVFIALSAALSAPSLAQTATPTPAPLGQKPSLIQERMNSYQNPLNKGASSSTTASSGGGSALNQPAKPAVAMKTSEDKQKQWKSGEYARITGEVIQNTSEGILVDSTGGGIGVRGVKGIAFVRGDFKTNAGSKVSIAAAFVDMLTYETLLHSRQTVPTFMVRQ